MSQGLTGVPTATARQASTASATTVTLPNGPMDATYPISGTTTITSITAGQAGRKATLEFQSANCTVVNGSNLKLAGRSFISTALRTLELESDGTNWVETSRGAFGTTLPVTQVFGDVASAGTLGEMADIGHIHGIPSLPYYQNAIDNGDLGRWRRGTSFPAIGSSAFFADGWKWTQSGVASVTIAQATVLPPIGANAINAVFAAKLTVQTPDTSIATTDQYIMNATVYGYDLRPLTNGMAFSFWVNAHRTGIYGIGLQNGSGDRGYVAEYTINVADTWEYKTIVIPAPPTAGTWNYTTGTGLSIGFVLSAGSNSQGTAGVWASSLARTTANQVNGVGATTDVFQVCLANMVPGTTPQPCQPPAYAINGMTDPILPTTANFGDAASAGTGQTSATSTHVHGMPTQPSFNALVNGDFAFAQTGLTSNPLVNGNRNLDSWAWSQGGDGTLYQTRIDGAAQSIIGVISLASYSYINVIVARTTSAVGDVYQLFQTIEGWDARHIVNGCTFSGWFNSSINATYCFSLRNRAANLSHVHPVPLTAGVWTYVSYTFPAIPPASITGNMRDNIGFYFTICLGAGTNWQTTADSWNVGNFNATSAQTNFPASLSAQFYMHALNLVPGSYVQPFVPMPYAQEQARVMRHRQAFNGTVNHERVGHGLATTTTNCEVMVPFQVPMLAGPSMTFATPSNMSLVDDNAIMTASTVVNSLPTPWGTTLSVSGAGGLTPGDAIDAYISGGSLIFESYPT